MLKPFFFSVLFFPVLITIGQTSDEFEKIGYAIQRGDLTLADSLLNRIKSTNALTDENLISYYNFLGKYYYTNGDFNEARDSWQKALPLIGHHKGYLLEYYNHMSLYAYELIQKEMMNAYTDSAYAILTELTTNEIVKHRGYNTWTYLGLSSKINFPSINSNKAEAYKVVQEYIQKSIDFLERYCPNSHDLARTYHRMANTHTDLCNHLSKRNPNEAQKALNSAFEFYNKALEIWSSLYGKVHPERARSIYVKTFNRHSRDERYLENHSYFLQAKEAFGLNNNTNLTGIPNKSEVLMFLKYYTQFLLKYGHEKDHLNWIDEAQNLNQLGIELWKIILDSYQNENTGRDFSIYSLNPYIESIEILLKKQKLNGNLDTESLFSVLQRVTLSDFQKDYISLSEFQKMLDEKEVFYDFLPEIKSEYYSFRITNSSADLIPLGTLDLAEIDSLRASILSRNLETFSKKSFWLYEALFPEGISDNTSSLIINSNSFIGPVPFEVLTTSNTTRSGLAYSELPYLKNKVDIRYVLGLNFTFDSIKPIRSSVGFFSPKFSGHKFTELPFSKKLGHILLENYAAEVFMKEKCNLKNLTKQSFDMLHLSTHAEIENDFHSSAIMLTNEVLKPEQITLFDTVPNLIVLNTCNSNLGKQLNGEGIDGFMRAFMKEGTSSCISNLWEVDDQVSNLLFEMFYKQLFNGSDAESALKFAKNHILNSQDFGDLSAPYYWASHRYVGENIRVESPKIEIPVFWKWIGIFMLILFSVGFIWYKFR